MKRKTFAAIAAVPLLASMLASSPATGADIPPNGSSVVDKAARAVHDIKQNEIAAKIAKGRDYINRESRTAREDAAAYNSFVDAYNMAVAKACQPNEKEADTYRGLAVIAAMNAGWTLSNTRYNPTGQDAPGNEWSQNVKKAIDHYYDAGNYRHSMQKGEVFVVAPVMGRLKVADPSLIEQRVTEAYAKLGVAHKPLQEK